MADTMPTPLPPDADEDRGQVAVAVYWTQAVVAVIVVGLRLYARRMIHSLGADDWLMFATLLLFIAICILVTYQSSLGGFKHIYGVALANLPEVGKINYVMQAFGLFSFVTGKAAVGYLILRVMGKQFVWQKWTIWTAIILTFVLNSINIIITFAQCDPPRALWHKEVPAKCWNPNVQSHYAFFVAAENILVDVVLALLPITILWKLNMSLRNRVILCILLGLGLCAAVSGIVKTTYLGSLTARSDITWETYNLVVWSGAEAFVIIICGSLPPLKPLWSHYVSRSTRTAIPDTENRPYGYSADSKNSRAPMLRRFWNSKISSSASTRSSSAAGLSGAAGSGTASSHVQSDQGSMYGYGMDKRGIYTARAFEVESTKGASL